VRLAFLSNYFPEHIGGIESVSAELVAKYRSSGHSVRWIAAVTRQAPHLAADDDVELPCWNLTEARFGFPYPIPAPWSWPRIVREVRRCDVVHLQDCLYLANLVAYLAARCLRRPVLVTQHIAGPPYGNPVVRVLQRTAYRTVGRMLLRGSDRVVFISPEVRRRLSSLAPFRHEAEIIPNGLDLSGFAVKDSSSMAQARKALSLSEDRPCLLFVGRFVAKKRISLLREVVASHPEWNWVFVGRADDADPSTWDLANLRVLPPMDRKSLASLYRAADLLVLPSAGEGFPVVVQEAMACGTPALVTPETASGAPEAGNLLFLSTADPRAMTSAIEDALRTLGGDPALGDRVASFARQHWDIASSFGRYEALLNELVSSRGDAS
jgi:glycosyltransferase involved in cell wall biosynthesis